MQQATNIRTKLGAKIWAVVLSIAMIVCYAPLLPMQAALADTTSDPFTAKVDGTAIASSDISLVEEGYAYLPYGATEATGVDMYEVTVPEGTTSVTFDFGTTATLLYYYDDASTYIGSVDDSVQFTEGATSYTAKLDSNSDGVNEYLFVQDPYNADYSGGDLRYVVTFVEEEQESEEGVTDEATNENANTSSNSNTNTNTNENVNTNTNANTNTNTNTNSNSNANANTNTNTNTNANANTNEGATTNAGAYTATKAATLISNLSDRFVAGGTDAAISNATYAAAFALQAQNLSANIDTDSVLAAMNKQKANDSYFSAGTMAKYILVLNAAGLDCTAVDDNGTTRDLIAEMTDSAFMGDVASLDVYSAVCILPAIDLAGKDTVDENTIDALVKVIVGAQDSKTGLFGGYGYFDSQTTAQAILALLPYKSDKSVSAAIKTAKKALIAMQVSDGGFGYIAGDTASNLDTTAEIVAALAAIGVDPTSVKTSDGVTPMDYLVAVADDDQAGYDGVSASNEPMSASVALMGLVANLGYQKAGAAFDVYTDVIKAKSETATTTTSTTTSKNTSTTATGTASASSTAKTGDIAASQALTAIVVLLCAAGVLVVMRRKSER